MVLGVGTPLLHPDNMKLKHKTHVEHESE